MNTRTKPTSVHNPEHIATAKVLRELRVKAGFTQAAVAEHLGMSQTGVSDLEIGNRGFDFQVIRKLCKLYGASVGDVDALIERELFNEKIEPALRLERKDKKRL